MSDNAPMKPTRAALLILVALSAACGSDGDSVVKKDGGNADTRIAADAPSDGPLLQPDLPKDTAWADAPTGGKDVAPIDIASLPEVGRAEVAFMAEVSLEAAVTPPLDAGTIDADEAVDLPILQPGQCRLSADCQDPLKPYCARIGVCVECEWNQECGTAAPYCVDYRCVVSPEGPLDGGILDADVTTDV